MKRYLGILRDVLLLLLVASVVIATPTEKQAYSAEADPGLIGTSMDDAGTVQGAAGHGVDCGLDSRGCPTNNWVKYDNRILNDGSNYWKVNANYSGTGGIVNNAVVLAKHDLSWSATATERLGLLAHPEVQGASTLSFAYLCDSEPGFDFITVETDSAGVSELLVNYSVDPTGTAASFRTVVFSTDGCSRARLADRADRFRSAGVQHEVYIRFASDVATRTRTACIHAVECRPHRRRHLDDGNLNYSENFEGR